MEFWVAPGISRPVKDTEQTIGARHWLEQEGSGNPQRGARRAGGGDERPLSKQESPATESADYIGLLSKL